MSQHTRRGSRTSPEGQWETRLRAALDADARNARISPDAWDKVHRRVAASRAGRRSGRAVGGWVGRPPMRWSGRRSGSTRRSSERPGDPPGHRRGLAAGLAAAVTAAAATVAVIVVPRIAGAPLGQGPMPGESVPGAVGPSAVGPSAVGPSAVGPSVAGPSGSSGPASPSPTSLPGPAGRQPTLAEASTGTELRVRLELVYGATADAPATVRLWPYRWSEGAWAPLGSDPAVVGRARSWAVDKDATLRVCELRVARADAQGEALGEVESATPTVYVRLGPQSTPKCSQVYVFQLRGDRLTAR